jgi:maleate cis-trans isomerase
MTTQAATKIGYVTAGSESRGTGHERIAPPGVELDQIAMGAEMDFTIKSSYDANRPLIGRKQAYLERVPEAVEKGGWHALVVMGWPVQMMNPGIHEELQTRVKVPVTTAAHASSTALRGFGAKRILLMTPWDLSFDVHLQHYLTTCGLEVVTPHSKPYDCIDNALAMPAEQVRELTLEAAREHSWVQAVYFQAPLRSYPVLEGMEKELGIPMVTSNIAALWYMLSALGQRHSISGYGRLLSQWPALP